MPMGVSMEISLPEVQQFLQQEPHLLQGRYPSQEQVHSRQSMFKRKWIYAVGGKKIWYKQTMPCMINDGEKTRTYN